MTRPSQPRTELLFNVLPAHLRGTLALALGLAAALAGARAHAGEVEGPAGEAEGDVTVRSERGTGDAASAVARTAPATLASIREDLRGLGNPGRVEIRIVRDARDLEDAAPGRRTVPEAARAAAFPAERIVVVAASQGGEPLDVTRLVAHELAQMSLDDALGARAPGWLREGFAQLHASEFSLARARALLAMAWRGETMGLGALSAELSAADVPSRARAQSADFVAYLARRGPLPGAEASGERWPFRNFLREVAGGEDVDSAARASFGASLGALYDEWYDDLRDRYFFAPASLFSGGIWAFAALLLCLAFIRKRRQKRATLRRWEEEEAAWSASASAGREGLPTATVRNG